VFVGNSLEIESILKSYNASPEIYDELLNPDGSVRSKYSFILKSFQDMGSHELNKRKMDADRILQENGVTYNIYGDEEKQERNWSLDLFPVLVPKIRDPDPATVFPAPEESTYGTR